MGCGVYQLSYAKLRLTRLSAKDCWQQKRATIRTPFARRFMRISTTHWVQRRDAKQTTVVRASQLARFIRSARPHNEIAQIGAPIAGAENCQTRNCTMPTNEPTTVATQEPATPGRLKSIGGSKSDDWNSVLANQTLGTLWLGNRSLVREPDAVAPHVRFDFQG
jgi:hypothetical protein